MRHRNRQPAPESAQAGFTLVEIIIVVCVLAVLVAIAVPQFTGARKATRDRELVEYMKQIGSAAKVYRTASGKGAYPDKLTTLTTAQTGEARPLVTAPDQTPGDTTLRFAGWTITLASAGANHFECQATPDDAANAKRVAVFEDATARVTEDSSTPTRNSPAAK